MRCYNCGCENADDIQLCEICGMPLNQSSNSDNDKNDDRDTDKPAFEKNKIIIIALVASIIIVVSLATVIAVKANKNSNNIGDNDTITHSFAVDIDDSDDESEYGYEGQDTEDETSTTEESTSKSNSTTTSKSATTKASEKKTSVSDWVLEYNAPNGAKIVQEKWTYDKIVQKTSKDNSPENDGYTLYDTDWSWGSYGSWSNWSTTVYSNSDSRETDARTTYRFHAFVCSKCGSRDPYSTPCDNCGTSSTMIWEETYFPFKGTSKSYTDIGGKPRISYEGKYWYFEYNGQTDGQGGTGQPSRKEYRYRDRSKVYTYYYQKTESKESNTKVTASDTISNVKHWVKYEK